MNTRILIFALLLVSFGMGGCLSTVNENPKSAVDHFGLESSSLGASGGRFAITSWSVNQDIEFVFNDFVDPTTVNLTSISITSLDNGATPSGEFLVRGKRVIFRPTTFPCDSAMGYGFTEGKTYEIYLQRPAFAGAPAPNAVHSLAGRPNETQIEGSITTSGINDLSPGAPSVEIGDLFSDSGNDRELRIPVYFNDVMQVCALANPQSGSSSVFSVTLFDQAGWTVDVVGTWEVVVDRDLLTTTAIFTPATPLPGNGADDAQAEPKRNLIISVSALASDVYGNSITNAGSFSLPLPYYPKAEIQLAEAFTDRAAFDSIASAQGLWAEEGPGLDSGLDPITQLHHGGGHGALGPLFLSSSVTFDTDSSTFFSPFLGANVSVLGGCFQFSDIYVGAEGILFAQGEQPLRLVSSGEFLVDGLIDVAGADGAINIGKFRPLTESALGEPSTNMFEVQAQGGIPGMGQLAAGSGGHGGEAWFYGRANGFSYDPNASNKYFYLDKNNWVDYEDPNNGNLADPTRYNEGLYLDDVCGQNGGPVGGGAAIGSPVDDASSIHLNFFDGAGLPVGNGAGMGTWAWPPFACQIPIGAGRIKTHETGEADVYSQFSIHRARGGGGASYWTAGVRGEVFELGAINPLGEDLIAINQEPNIDAPSGLHEFNGDGLNADLFVWNAFSPASTPIVDGAHGVYDVPVGQESLNPESGFLLGGAGGGGAGNSDHGSYAKEPHPIGGSNGEIDTFRSCDGAGGGAGGGAIQLHAGSNFGLNGVIDARGGNGGLSAFMQAIPFAEEAAILMTPPGDAGGGGGSGGAVLIQAPVVQLDLNSIRLLGGTGGKGSAGNSGGDGGAGVLHIDVADFVSTNNPPIGLSMADFAFIVQPLASVDLAPTGQNIGEPNLGLFSGEFGSGGGDDGDISVEGLFFNGNSSSVQSLWLNDFPSQYATATLLGWTVDYEYRVKTGEPVLTKSFTHLDYGSLPAAEVMAPGTSPFWVAFQAGYAASGADLSANPDAVYNETPWSIPGRNDASDIDILRTKIVRAWRFRIGFDHDIIHDVLFQNQGDAGSYLRVTNIQLDWTCD
jgi:hypothetical protein